MWITGVAADVWNFWFGTPCIPNSLYFRHDFKPLGNTDAKIDEFVTFKIVTSIDYPALGQNYVIIGRANGNKDVTFYECIHWSPLENVSCVLTQSFDF